MIAVEYVNVHGEAVNTNARPPRRTAKRDAPEEWHRGFRVDGHPPGAMESARAACEKDRAEWSGLSEVERAKRLTSGEREPKEWNEAVWRATAKLTRVAKPYAVPEAADLCRELAERAGWLDVRITELAKRRGQQ